MSSSSSPPSKTRNSGAGNRRAPSRLQRRAPPLKITPATASAWNAAIPLLSPLAGSPTPSSPAGAAAEQMPVFKKWQHPAAPFCYDTASFGPPFVPV
ncbi:PREDICTED: uncharacterized protein At4g14450, chloroplastic-like [Tarenaya hassleriana]|uniref:uncharacterized protein At4g14450, chloroplastic-like n=1 Tax=Tarenaya hassleriana TaxID=28532 RepID=UPI00053C2852|nr:PREDICTED: uncharacterized protein At4g14450, chloroplastic-like [Tarenaya hassleriana]